MLVIGVAEDDGPALWFDSAGTIGHAMSRYDDQLQQTREIAERVSGVMNDRDPGEWGGGPEPGGERRRARRGGWDDVVRGHAGNIRSGSDGLSPCENSDSRRGTTTSPPSAAGSDTWKCAEQTLGFRRDTGQGRPDTSP